MWQPISTAPKDGTKVDLWAKCWLASSDSFTTRRFTDCWWTKGDSITGRREHWMGFDDGWCATHWMKQPDPPATI